MGRYYHGDITGKFWFGVQNSDDAKYFGVEPEFLHEFHECGCHIEIYDHDDPRLTDQLYCTDCYSSVEEHREAIDYSDEDSTWFLREISFTFRTENLEILEQKVSLLSRQVGQFMEGYTILGDKNGEFSYDYTIQEGINSSITPTQREQIARLCLGKLIYHCVIEKGECMFYAEL